MQIKLGCVDGKTYIGDYVTDEEILEEINMVNGRVGTGAMAGLVVNTVEDFAQMILDMVQDKDTTAISLNISGRKRLFRQQTIVWCEITLDNHLQD